MYNEISIDTLRSLLTYDAETGRFFWNPREESYFRDNGRWSSERNMKVWNTKNAGKEAFTTIVKGYREARIFGHNFKAHRVAWAMHYGEWPVGDVDHKNMNRSDNRIENLRIASRSENMSNRGKQKNNTSGYKGVYLHRASGLWHACVVKNGVKCSLGYFSTPDEAGKAYSKAAYKLNNDFFRS